MVWSLFGYKEEPVSTKHRKLDDEASKTVEEALECDYDRNCTPLYKKIENSMEDTEWEPVVKFLDTGYWPGSLFMDSITPAEQARCWVTRFDVKDNSKVKWSQLPLHLAIVCDAPFKVVARLVELYPQAVRCTDDQHMLPLHLALRHNASDEIVAYLLTQFPEAVNAKGKDNRTPIECAMRAENKLRGKILQVFVDKTKSKVSAKESALKATLATKVAEMDELEAALNARIAAKETELKKANDSLLAAEKNKVMAIEKLQLELEKAQLTIAELEQNKGNVNVELAQSVAMAEAAMADLEKKVAELEEANMEISKSSAEAIRKLEDQRMMEELEYQQKISELEATRQELEDAHQKAREEEKMLRVELQSVQSRVATAAPEELDALKREVEDLKEYRMEHSRTRIQEQFEVLRSEMEKTMRATHGKTAEELKSMQRAFEELRAAENKAKSNEEMDALRAEVEHLRAELKAREAASKTKIELALMRKAMESELNKATGKTQEELSAIRSAVDSMNLAELGNKTNEELNTLKKELDSLKKELRENELASKTKQEVDELRAQLEQELVAARGETKNELGSMKKAVEQINASLMAADTNDQIIALKKELATVKDELKNKEEATKTKKDVEDLRKILEAELSQSRGATNVELNMLKKTLDSINADLKTSKTNDEVLALKKELDALKQEMKQIEEVAQTKKDVEELKAALEKQLHQSHGATNVELAMMKKTVDHIYSDLKNSKTNDEVLNLKKELDTLKSGMKQMDEVAKTKKDVDDLRKSLERGLGEARGATKVELNVMKKALDGLYFDLSASKTNDEIVDLKKELATLKDELKVVEEAAKTKKDVEDLKAVLDREIKQTRGTTSVELAMMKKTVDSMYADLAKSQSNDEILLLKEAVDALKAEMKNKEETAKTKKEVEELKLTLERELAEARGATKKELATIKQTVDSLHENLSKNKTGEDIVQLKKELITVKEQLQAQEELTQMKQEMLEMKRIIEAELKNVEGKTKEELAKMKRAIKSADEKQLESKSFDELHGIRNELEELRRMIAQKEEVNSTKQDLVAMKKALENQMKTWEGKTKEDLMVMKATVDALSVAKLDGKSTEEWEAIKEELAFLKMDVQSAEAASRTKQELEALRRTLEKELKSSEGKTQQELMSMKRAVDSIDVGRLEIRNKSEWEAIRAELDAVKSELRQKEIGTVTLQQEIAQLRLSQTVAAQETLKPKQRRGLRRFFSRFRGLRGENKESDREIDDNTLAETYIEHNGSDRKGITSSKTTSVIETDDEDEVATYLPPSIARPGSYMVEKTDRTVDEEEVIEEVKEEVKNSVAAPYQVKRTVSKTVSETGDVELEVDEDPLKVSSDGNHTVVSF